MAKAWNRKGTLTTSGQSISIGDGSGEVASMQAIQLTGTWTGTVAVQGTLDGATYVALLMVPSDTTTGVTSTTANGVWRVDATGLSDVIVICTAVMTGTVNVFARPVRG